MTSTAVDVIAHQVKDARARGARLRIAGAGTWMDGGRPCAASERIDLSRHDGIVDYVPGDLTLTARAGTSLAEIARVTDEHGQWLALDPFGAPEGTLGATVATASAGPLASAYGTPRDHVLGCEFVSGTGDVVRAGGRVVKNVAGFDLVRLVTGAWGTLGVITEIAVRLRARPEHDETMVIAAGGQDAAAFAASVKSWLRSTPLTPLCAELVSPALAVALGSEGSSLLLRWGGNAAFTRAAVDDSASLGALERMPSSTWTRLASAEPAGAMVFRASTLPSQLPALWSRAVEIAERLGGWAHATAVRGVVRCVVPAAELTTAALDALARDATIVGERLSPALWTHLAQSRSSDALRAGVKRAFDPDGVLNPGILGTS